MFLKSELYTVSVTFRCWDKHHEERVYFTLRFLKKEVHHGGEGVGAGAWGWPGSQKA